MKPYQYQVVRYVHDHFTGEYVNVGVVVYNPENRYLACKITNKYQRITSMFADANGVWIMKILRDFEKKLHQTTDRLSELFQPSDQIENVTGSIIPNDDTAIRFSEAYSGVDIDYEVALEDLFNSLVEKHIHDSKKDTLLDEDVWKEKYKKYFEKYGIADRLNEHIVKISDLPEDYISFNKAWKNEIWHCYEPLSFVVKNRETVKNKVHKWSGRLNGLRRAGEPIHLTLMVSFSEKHKKMQPFIEQYLITEYKTSANNLRVEIVTDDQAEFLAEKVSKEMEAHSN